MLSATWHDDVTRHVAGSYSFLSIHRYTNGHAKDLCISPAVAAGVGFFFYNTKKLTKGISASDQETRSTRVLEEQTKAIKKPSVAPHFDGLHCFETFVMN
ncbi:hypothetical protein Ahy_A09g045114 [Arachis hypogaea]|uniref:Uncharacterized protein n=1 Tax=Arachis hypogaea TaxID=3818 RepID=A0A445BLK7_ARAHY|nr:hypothetical protein Ahy_A09g045114 [Arachis hypogaea]